MSLLSIYSGSACAWIISEINRDTMGELQVVIPKAASTLLYPMVRPLTVRLGSLLLRIYSAFSFVLFSALYFLKTANIQELNVLLFAEYNWRCIGDEKSPHCEGNSITVHLAVGRQFALNCLPTEYTSIVSLKSLLPIF